MQLINPTDLEHFLHQKLSVSIQDVSGEEEQAPFLEKTLEKIELCPDATHIRLFFDAKQFLAIPRDATVSLSTREWTAHDSGSQLNYVIRKVTDHNE